MTLLQMSIQGAVLTAVVALVRAAGRERLPRQTFPILWGVVMARLLIPFSVPSPYSAYTAAERSPLLREPLAPILRVQATAQKSVPYRAPLSPWTVLWAVGAAALALYFLLGYLHFRREFRFSLPVEEAFPRQWLREHPLRRRVQLRQSGSLSAPLTYGIRRPVILFPGKTDWSDTEQIRYILMHEMTHIRRLDPVWKLLSTAALCLHWFNPLVWLMCVLFSRDLELSCDACVVRQLGEPLKSAYAMALIRLEERKSGLDPLQTGFSRTAIEERIRAIMRFRKTSLAALTAAVLLVSGVTAVFATSAKAVSQVDPADAAMMEQFRFPGWEDMAVDEFRERAWVLLDEPDMWQWWLSVENEPDQMYSDPLYASLYGAVYELTAERWQSPEYAGCVVTDLLRYCNQAVLEYDFTIDLVDPGRVTVQEYLAVGDRAFRDMESLLHECAKGELADEAFMEVWLEEQIPAVSKKWSTDGLRINPVEWNYQPLLTFGDDSAGQGGGSDGSGSGTYTPDEEEREYPPATEEDYRSLLALKTPGYKNMTLETFNAALLDWANANYERSERIGCSAAMGEIGDGFTAEEREFLTLTATASGAENGVMVRSLYTGRPEEDPGFGGETFCRETAQNGRAAWFEAYYAFRYHISDKAKTTVGERDRCVGGFQNAANAFLNDTPLEEMLLLDQADLVEKLEQLAAEYSTENVQIRMDANQVGYGTMDERGLD